MARSKGAPATCEDRDICGVRSSGHTKLKVASEDAIGT